MRKILTIILVLFALATPLQLAAAQFDGSAPLLCAVIEVIECDAGGDCLEIPAEMARIPHFLVINFADKTISATEESGREETTAIQNVQRIGGKLILQGAENGRGWSIVISEDSGRMSATVFG